MTFKNLIFYNAFWAFKDQFSCISYYKNIREFFF